nr:probable pectate lyase 5 [Ipomoea trifida]
MPDRKSHWQLLDVRPGTGRATASGWRTVALDLGKRHAMRRKDSKIYIVCDSSDQESLCIIFAADMTIKLKHELIFITEENNLEGSLMKKPKARVKVNAMKTLLSKELSCWKRNLSGKLATGNYGKPDDLHGAAHQNPSKPKIKSI